MSVSICNLAQLFNIQFSHYRCESFHDIIDIKFKIIFSQSDFKQGSSCKIIETQQFLFDVVQIRLSFEMLENDIFYILMARGSSPIPTKEKS